MNRPKLNSAQTLAVALISAIARDDIPTATRIVRTAENPDRLALHCATMAARAMSPARWQLFLDLIARDEAADIGEPQDD